MSKAAARLISGSLALALAGGLLVARASAEDVDRGRKLATAWCASCHVVEPGGGTSDVSPSFELIANRPDQSERGLRAWLVAPHPPMPELSLEDGEIEDLIGFILSLRQAPAPAD